MRRLHLFSAAFRIAFPAIVLILFIPPRLLPFLDVRPGGRLLEAQTSSLSIAATPDYQPLEVDRGSSGLWQSLRKLSTRASLMMITAHPDDEDGGMLAYESRGKGARVALLSLNRGEGGQNVMSNDYWDRLALVRTEELLATNRYDGVDQLYFTRVADFGFSKTLDESLSLWGHDRVLYDVVRAVRLNRPLVITSVFVGGITDGHGQHQVAGEMTQEVFKAAGDPTVFPDQIKAGLLPWSPLKVYARVPAFSISDKGMYDYATGKWAPVRFYDYVTGKWSSAVPATNLTIPEGDYDPVLGCSYLQIARRGFGLQKSQNGGSGIPLSGAFSPPYHRYGSRVAASDSERSFFDGIDISIAGIASLSPDPPAWLTTGLQQIADSVDQATSHFSASEPERIAPMLAAGLSKTQSLIHETAGSKLSPEAKFNILHELSVKEAQFNQAIAQSLGLTLTAVVAPAGEDPSRSPFATEASPTFTAAVPGQAFAVNAYLTNPGGTAIQVEGVTLRSTDAKDWQIVPERTVAGSLKDNQRVAARFHVTVPADAPPTKAYFHRDSVEQPYYDIDDPRYLNLPLPPYPLEAWAEFTYEGAHIRMAQVIQTVQHMAGQGSVYQPLIVAPAISVTTTVGAGVVPLENKTTCLVVRVHGNVQGAASTKGTVHLQLPSGWTSSPPSAAFEMSKNEEEQDLTFTVTNENLAAKSYSITPVADYDGRQYATGYVPAGYPGLRPYNYYGPKGYRLTGVDVRVAPGLNVGYVMGTGDDVPESLKSLGVNVRFLSPVDIAGGDLSKYDVIILGIRAYAARPELAAATPQILDYVKNGGVVIVQYNTGEYDHNYGPYPYTLGAAEKVVDEHARVQLLAPQNPLLGWPNRITPADFDGWVEERGHSFMESWDPHYEAVSETHDPDQAAQKGGLLYARYGRGAYVYLAFALYRQLPEGVPGAYRLFANLLSLPKAPPLAVAASK